jgi:hypothetical protein
MLLEKSNFLFFIIKNREGFRKRGAVLDNRRRGKLERDDEVHR